MKHRTITTAISLTALLISLAVAWFTVLSPSEIDVSLGNQITLQIATVTTNNIQSKVPGISAGISITNSGARPSKIEEIGLVVNFNGSKNHVIFTPEREVESIRIFSAGGIIDFRKQEENIKDVFNPFVILPKSTVDKKYVFLPLKGNIDADSPNIIEIGLWIKEKHTWKKYDSGSFYNDKVDLKTKKGWAILEALERKESYNDLIMNQFI